MKGGERTRVAEGAGYQGEIIDGDLRDEIGGSTDTCRWFTSEQAARLNLGELARHALATAAADAAKS